MQISDFKTWHWVAIGLVVGLLYSCVLVYRGPWFDTEDLNTIMQGEFENALSAHPPRKFGADLVAKYQKKDAALTKDLIVHPPFAGDVSHRYWVTGKTFGVFRRNTVATDPKSPLGVFEEWTPFKYAAPVPYVGANGAKATFATVGDYLKADQALATNRFAYKFAWWETPAALWTLPPAAGLMLIGMAWPLTLSVMQRAGMATPPKRVKVAKPAPAPAPVPARRPDPGVVFIPPVVKAPEPVGDHKQYGGEFYPVVKAVHHEE